MAPRRKRTRTRRGDSDSEDFLSSSSDDEPQQKPQPEPARAAAEPSESSESDSESSSSSDWRDSSEDEETPEIAPSQRQTAANARIPRRTPSPEPAPLHMPTAALLDPANQLFKPLVDGPILGAHALHPQAPAESDADAQYSAWWREQFAAEFQGDLGALYAAESAPDSLAAVLEHIDKLAHLRTSSDAATVWKHDASEALDPLSSLPLPEAAHAWASVSVGGKSDVDVLLASLADQDVSMDGSNAGDE